MFFDWKLFNEIEIVNPAIFWILFMRTNTYMICIKFKN